MLEQTSDTQIELIDFSLNAPTNRLIYAERIAHDGITVTRCLLSPNPGAMIGALQHTVIIHESEPFDLEWRMPVYMMMLMAGQQHTARQTSYQSP